MRHDPYERRHPTRSQRNAAGAGDGDNDRRTETQKDRDRIQYTEAFARLAGVTQVVGATEGHVFHNRLTHTLEVAQLSLRLATQIQKDNEAELTAAGVVIDADAAEAAALAHDLGHPPFGHIAEDELNDQVLKASGAQDQQVDLRFDGYEGNAQSFRIVTQLAAHQTVYRGLNLTRATLNAMVKYPWPRSETNAAKKRKHGYFKTELADFEFARLGTPRLRRSPEAQIMDHADNIAYSVHDVIDFYRAGLIPLELISADAAAEVEGFRLHLVSNGEAKDAGLVEGYEERLTKWASARFPRQRYDGDSTQRYDVRAFGSELIHRFVAATTFHIDAEDSLPRIGAAEQERIEMKFLQRLVWKYVINNPRLATQQHGQRTIVRKLYCAYNDAIRKPNDSEARRLIPREFVWQLDDLKKGDNQVVAAARLSADIVSSFTDAQAVKVFQRITGMWTGSVADILDG